MLNQVIRMNKQKENYQIEIKHQINHNKIYQIYHMNNNHNHNHN